MKKIIITIALVLIGLTSCKKEVITPNCPVTPSVELGTVISTNLITNYIIPEDTFYALKFKSSGGADQIFMNPCGETSISTSFNSTEETRVEIYKNGDGNPNYVWMGTIKVNPADSSFIITKIGGVAGTILLAEEVCDQHTQLIVLD